METQWQDIMAKLSQRLEPGLLKIWVKPLEAKLEEGCLTLTAPKPYMAQWLQSKLLSVLESAAREVLGAQTQVRIGVREHPAPSQPRRVQSWLPMLGRTSPKPKNWRYNFSDFVVGESNRVAVAAAKDVCRSDGGVQTLYVNAQAGLGKTHLAQAVGCDITENPGRTVDYMTAEEFSARFVASLKTNEVENFKDRLRHLDVLLFEDVHFLQNKPKIQETALSVVKAIQEHGGRVIFTSSFSPREMQKVDSQLVSSFCSGILTQIDRPDESMRCEIIQRKARAMQMSISDQVCLLLAKRLDSDVRQIESCLKSVVFKAKLLQTEITPDLALEILAQYSTSTSVDLSFLSTLVCEFLGLELTNLHSRSRCQNYVVGRNTIFYLARKHTDLTLKEIGEPFNRRHSTVLQGITSIERELAKQSSLGRQIARVLALVEEKAGLTRTSGAGH